MYVIIFTTVCFSLNAQNKESVEKSIFNAQIGTVGVWVNNEIRLSDGIALWTEGSYMEIIKGVGFFTAREITFEQDDIIIVKNVHQIKKTSLIIVQNFLH